MYRTEVNLYCVNPACQMPNPLSHRFCQHCRSPLVKRYLWCISATGASCEPGSWLGDRYWCLRDRVFLDTNPALMPEFPTEISAQVEPYLRLIGHQPQVPQVYAVVANPDPSQREWVLLEAAAILPAIYNAIPGSAEPDSPDAESAAGELLPAIAQVWAGSQGLRQLHWLWQLAQLWDPLVRLGVAQTLCTPDLIRVEHDTIRLLELVADASPLTLVQLGQTWQSWVMQAHPTVQEFLATLCDGLMTGSIDTSEALIDILDRAIAELTQPYRYQLQVMTLTDQGPSRQRNEDACFPPSGQQSRVDTLAARGLPLQLLTIVCDGIGGHEGGDVASNLAIAALQQSLSAQIPAHATDATTVMLALEKAVLAANDAIAQRNDAEHRQDRQRMGTTVVLAATQGHELYLAHIGDSRAYRITRTGCHQVTLDDDLATREVRMGYSLYREAVRHPTGGSLVQALGMNTSTILRPTVRRFVLDQDCVFLLCSDGLSDYDRVEQSWQLAIAPLLTGALDITTTAQQLVAIANQQNGHDNVTVGVVQCRVLPPTEPGAPLSPSLAESTRLPERATPTARPTAAEVAAAAAHATAAPTQKVPQPRRWSIPWLVGLAVVLGVGGALSVGLIQLLQSLSSPPVATPSPETAIPSSPPPLASPSPQFDIGTRFLVNRAAPGETGTIALVARPEANPTAPPSRSLVPVGTVLEVIRERSDETNQRWLGVKVCSVPTNSATAKTVMTGELGWVPEAAIAPLVTTTASLTAVQLGQCAPASPIRPDANPVSPAPAPTVPTAPNRPAPPATANPAN